MTTGLLLPRNAKPSYKAGYARSAGESANPGLWKELVGAWIPAFGATGSQIIDVSGNGHTGNLEVMDPATDWIVSGGHTALDFDGVNDRVDIGPNLAYSREQITIFIRMYSDSGGATFREFVSQNQTSNNWRGRVGNPNSDTWFSVYISAVEKRSDTSGLPTDEWVNWVGRYDGSFVTQFHNGKEVGIPLAATGTIDGGAGNTAFGAKELGGGAWLGKQAACCIWDRALSDQEVTLLDADPLAPFRRKPLFISMAGAAPLSISTNRLPLLSVG